MNWLNRIPIWAWLLFTLTMTYAVWNPSDFSLWHMWFYSDVPYSFRALVFLIMFGIVIIYALEAWRSLGMLGIVIFGGMILCSLWILYDFGMLRYDNLSSARWWVQIPIALLLTVGFQGGRIYRSLTGRVPVSPDSGAVAHDTGYTHDVGDHHGGVHH